MRSRLAPALALLLAAGLLSACGAAASSSPTEQPAAAPDTSLNPSGTGLVTIRPGATGSDIGRALEQAGVTGGAEFYQEALRRPDAARVQPGQYQLSTGISAGQALDELLDGDHLAGEPLVVHPGDTALRLLPRLIEATGASEEASRKALELPSGQVTSALDGLLGPATYPVAPGEDPGAVVARMRQAMEPVLAEAELLAAGTGHTPQELLVIASLLQAEVRAPDWGKAARAIENRLATGMRLQLDSTAAYAAGVRQVSLSAEQLQADSPFNTYRVDGLPPAPIGMVDVEAVRAAAAPEDGTWLYWVTVDLDSGLTRFSSSYSTFLQDKDELRSWLAANG
jgi:UPF0755 protein